MEKIFANYISDKGLISSLYKELLPQQLDLKMDLRKRTWIDISPKKMYKEDTQITNKHMKRCSTSLIIRKMQIKTKMSSNAYMRDSKRDTDLRTDFWTLWEKARVGWFERTALKHVYCHMWTRSPVQVRCMKQGTQSQCTGTTQRERRGREVGVGFRMGDTWWIHPWLIHVNVWQNPPQYRKVISLQLK